MIINVVAKHQTLHLYATLFVKWQQAIKKTG